jgi:hypothetical protein
MFMVNDIFRINYLIVSVNRGCNIFRITPSSSTSGGENNSFSSSISTSAFSIFASGRSTTSIRNGLNYCVEYMNRLTVQDRQYELGLFKMSLDVKEEFVDVKVDRSSMDSFALIKQLDNAVIMEGSRRGIVQTLEISGNSRVTPLDSPPNTIRVNTNNSS